MEAIRFTLSNNVLPMGQLTTAGIGVGQAGKRFDSDTACIQVMQEN